MVIDMNRSKFVFLSAIIVLTGGCDTWPGPSIQNRLSSSLEVTEFYTDATFATFFVDRCDFVRLGFSDEKIERLSRLELRSHETKLLSLSRDEVRSMRDKQRESRSGDYKAGWAVTLDAIVFEDPLRMNDACKTLGNVKSSDQ